MMGAPDSGAAPDQEGIEGRRVEPAPSSVAADDTECPRCGREAYDAIRDAKNMIIRQQATIDRYNAAFDEVWDLGRPKNWRSSIRQLINAGLPRSAMLDAAHIALDANHVDTRKRFAYFMGVARHKIRDMDGYALERMLRETT